MVKKNIEFLIKMKSIIDTITESIVTEGLKDIYKPRKGSTIYILKNGESKVVPVKIADTFFNTKADCYDVKLAENAYNITAYFYYYFKRNEEPTPVMTCRINNADYYIGISPKAIQEFIRVVGKRQLDNILSRIAELEEDLKRAYRQKEEFEYIANIEISESLKQ